MADEYPEYSGLTKAELQAKLDANVARQEALDAQVNALRADARLAEQQRIEFQKNYDSGFKFSEVVSVNKQLEANPNDPAALAEKARLDGLIEQRKAAFAPYQQAEDQAYAALQQSPAVQEQNALFSEAGDIDHAIRLSEDPRAAWGGGVNNEVAENVETSTDESDTPEAIAAEEEKPAVEETPVTEEKPEEIGETETTPDQDPDVVTSDDEIATEAEKTEAEKAVDSEKTDTAGDVTVSSAAATTQDEGTVIVVSKIAPQLKQNILHEFSSYTYHIELFILGVNDYNDFVSDPDFTIENKPGRLLIKSGGGSYSTRNKYFSELDYFIDDLQIDSVIAPSGNNIGTTNTNLSFTITEPYGITLFNSLVLAAADVGSYNYTDQPYLLKISFKGYDDRGNPVNNGKQHLYTRYIPIRITDFKFSVNAEGTVYNISAIPYHSLGVQSHKSTIPTDIQLDAITVGDFFVKQLKTVTDKKIAVNVSENPELRVLGREPTYIEAVTENVQGGLAGYLNYLEKEHVKEKGKSVADEYAFEIDPDIGDSKIVLQQLVDIIKSKNDNDPRKIALGQYYNNFEFNEDTQTYTIRAGTSVINVIHSIMRTSEYLINQVAKEDLKKSSSEVLGYEELKDKPIEFYRIVPRVELKEPFDTIRNLWPKKITYVLKKYKMTGKNFENLGQAQIEDFVKEYKYIYTGQNTDILNFDIDFNTAYFQKNIYNAARKSMDMTTSAALTAPEQFADGNTAKLNPNALSNAFPVSYEVVTDIGSDKDISDPRGSDLSRVIDNFMFMVFNGQSSADMVELNLDIVGDPSYIQSNDIRQVILDTYNAPYYDRNLTLNPDKEWQIYIEFRSPIDVDTRTGLMEGFNIGSKGIPEVTTPVINGYYRALEVKSTFTGGKFTQNLRCIREPQQVTSYVAQKDTDPARNELVNSPPPKNGQVPNMDKNSSRETVNGKQVVSPPSIVTTQEPTTQEDLYDIGDIDLDNYYAPDASIDDIGIDLDTSERFDEFSDIPTDVTQQVAPDVDLKNEPAPTTFFGDDQTEIGGP